MVRSSGPDHPEGREPLDNVRRLQRRLFVAAKRHRTRRFHALYSHICRNDVLREAWRRVRRNGGAAGVDGETLVVAEEYGVEKLLAELQEALRSGRYRPSPVLRRHIPKATGGTRPLGIPTVKDRVAQMAAKLVVEPIFEADFRSSSYGYRPQRRALDALETIRETADRGHSFVLDGDIADFFGGLDHEILMSLIAKRVSDRRVLRLIRRWLGAGVMEDGIVRDNVAGVPQGGVISPLLADIYLHVLDSVWEDRCGHLGRLVRYADDCAPRRRREEAIKADSKHLAAQEMRVGPSEPPQQEEAPNHRMLLRSNGRGGERDGQGAPRVRQVRARKASVVEPLKTCRKRMDDARTGQSRWPGMSLGDPCIPPRRRPALRWREPGSGSCAERGNLRADAKGDPQAAGTARGRVPTRCAGADRPV